MKYALVAIVMTLLVSVTASAKTLMLEGKLDSSITMRQQIEFNVDKGEVQTFTFTFALPADFKSKSVSQTVDSLSTRFNLQPSKSIIKQDRFGNRFQTVVWNNVSSDIRVNLTYIATVRSELSAMESSTPFPIERLSNADAVFLTATDMVQSDSADIANLARTLTATAKNEYEAVTAITNHVADTIKYTFNPSKYDALYTLRTRSGNCQNFAHLCIALLRSVGIPARIVGGITLKDSWKVPIDSRNSIVQSMGQGGHAWMEIYFPDLGWLPYDPQQSRQFTSSRHIKQTHGLDSRDINDTWRGAPYLPRYSELIEGSFRSDDITLKVRNSEKDPRPYIISNLVAMRTFTAPEDGGSITPTKKPKTKPDLGNKPPKQPGKPPVSSEFTDQDVIVEPGDPEVVLPVDEEMIVPPKKPAKIAKQPSKPPKKPVRKKNDPVKKPVITKIDPVKVDTTPPSKKPAPGTPVVFGNMDFPNLVDTFTVLGDTGTRILDKETSEYVTSQHIYAQAFRVGHDISLEKVSLAMRKFGGDGTVYIDVVNDGGNKPNIREGFRSSLISLEKVSRKPGYYWVDFSFPSDVHATLEPGKYWVVLRYSGDAIMNWFYIPGKPYSGSDDTRSTAKGFQWEDILNYDFVFKVTGKTL